MNVRGKLAEGLMIPAHPLALTSTRKLDERRQRALTRYYLAAGAGGIAVGVHTTQFAIRDPTIGLYRPLLELAVEETANKNVAKIAGVCGDRHQAVREAELARGLGYDAVLLSMGGLKNLDNGELVEHAKAVAGVIPVIGFYLQPSVGGRLLSYEFWREFAQIENVVAIKMAPFNRYQTIDVLRTTSQAALPGFMRYCAGKVCCKGRGVSMSKSRSRPVKARKSTEFTAHIPTFPMMPLCGIISMNGCDSRLMSQKKGHGRDCARAAGSQYREASQVALVDRRDALCVDGHQLHGPANAFAARPLLEAFVSLDEQRLCRSSDCVSYRIRHWANLVRPLD
jgi:dihydrodipicolinate synthase/N-acetylneuraminate lyase